MNKEVYYSVDDPNHDRPMKMYTRESEIPGFGTLKTFSTTKPPSYLRHQIIKWKMAFNLLRPAPPDSPTSP